MGGWLSSSTGSSSGQAGDGGDQAGGGGAATTSSSGNAGGRQCAPDLQTVVADDGTLIEVCPSDQGCFDGDCIAACDAVAEHEGNLGCAFSAATPPSTGAGWPGGEAASLLGPCYAAFVANTWSRPAKLSLSYGGQVIDLSPYARIPSGPTPHPTYEPLPAEGVAPGAVAIVFLSHDPQANNSGIPLTCPVAPAIAHTTALSGSGRGSGFRITSDTPISAYALHSYGGAWGFIPSATLLIPESTLATDYVVAAPHDDAINPILAGQLWVNVVGIGPSTSVTITPRSQLPAGPGVPTAPANQPTTVQLSAGETIQWLGMGSDPSGAIIEASQPVAVFAGNTYLRVVGAESVDGGHDASHQQIPPVAALGHEYVGAGVVTRLANLEHETVFYRLVGVVDGTVLEWDPAPPAGAPTVLAAGQAAEFGSKDFFRVRSQGDAHPFMLTQYMSGSVFATVTRQDGTQPRPIGVPLSCGIGDEEWVHVMAPDQFLRRYVFFTDPTFATTNLVLTRRRDESGFHDVAIGCLGVVSDWEDVGHDGDYQVAHVDLIRGNLPQGQCGSSRHEAWSDGAFGLTVWGTDWCASYAYPAGGGFGRINSVTP